MKLTSAAASSFMRANVFDSILDFLQPTLIFPDKIEDPTETSTVDASVME